MAKDPKLYRQLQIPFVSIDEAQKASDAFQEELAELRKKHRMRDVVVVCSFSWEAGDGNESDAVIIGSWGDSTKAEFLVAYALGSIQVDRQEQTGKLLRGVRSGKRD